MSMMDAMNQAAQPQPQPQAAPPQGAPQQGQSGNPMQPQEFLRMGGDDPVEMENLYNKIMVLISSEIWEQNGADQVAEQLMQDDSQPAEVIGKFTGFYLMMATAAARAKGGMLPPVVVVGAAGEVAAQLTDVALALELVAPEDADDTADAGALVGIEVLIQNAGQQMAPDEKQEYVDITTAIIKASPNAQQLAEEATDDAVEDVQEMQGGGEDEQNNEGDLVDNTSPQPGDRSGAGMGMAAAMGGQ